LSNIQIKSPDFSILLKVQKTKPAWVGGYFYTLFATDLLPCILQKRFTAFYHFMIVFSCYH